MTATGRSIADLITAIMFQTPSIERRLVAVFSRPDRLAVCRQPVLLAGVRAIELCCRLTDLHFPLQRQYPGAQPCCDDHIIPVCAAQRNDAVFGSVLTDHKHDMTGRYRNNRILRDRDHRLRLTRRNMDVYRRVICLQAGGQGGCSLEPDGPCAGAAVFQRQVALNTRLRGSRAANPPFGDLLP